MQAAMGLPTAWDRASETSGAQKPGFRNRNVEWDEERITETPVFPRALKNPVSERVSQQHILHVTSRAITGRASEETGFLVTDIRDARSSASAPQAVEITPAGLSRTHQTAIILRLDES
jgi:hypothetical protein